MAPDLIVITATVPMDKNNGGFTFLEILMVIFIITLFTTISVGGYTSFNENKKIDKDVNQMISALELAKKKTRAGDKSGLTQSGTDYSLCDLDGYKVSITSSTTYALQASVCSNTSGSCPVVSGCSDITIAPYSLASSMSIMPATGSVVFQNNALTVSGVSTITVTNAKNYKSKAISISESGAIEAN